MSGSTPSVRATPPSDAISQVAHLGAYAAPRISRRVTTFLRPGDPAWLSGRLAMEARNKGHSYGVVHARADCKWLRDPVAVQVLEVGGADVLVRYPGPLRRFRERSRLVCADCAVEPQA